MGIRRMIIPVAALILMATAVRLPAEVFTLWPFRAGAADPAAVLQGRDLWTEPVILNGVRTELGIGLVEQNLRDCFEILKRLYPDARLRWNKQTLVMEIRDGQGRRQRLYLVALGGAPYPVVRFRLDLPETFPTPLPWPKDIPLPPDATPRQSLEFPGRDATFGQFATTLPPPQALAEMSTRLRAEGWSPTTAESGGTGLDGNGEIFFRPHPAAILILTLNGNADGGSTGAAYSRRLSRGP